ncbi:MAG: Gfo/Idh/MocA family protein [Sphaerochaetaceae bacterium]|jgi:myo-inositol 2-dehydrogenase/D-chiro-inositol 1-dehydrogenase
MKDVLKIGVIGIGAIGQIHVERISKVLKNGVVVAVSDVRKEFGEKYAKENNCKYYEDGVELINSQDVDAVMVTTIDAYHEFFVSECIKAGKFCFVEKPLAPDVEGCRNIVDLEIAGGKKLVQVGFMRRYDRGYNQLKELVDTKKLGEALMIHSAHRNPEVGKEFVNSFSVENAMIHEIDLYRWMLNEEYVSAEVVYPKQTRHTHKDLKDPQIMYLTTESGIRIDVEAFVNARYAYDIQCEVCFEEGVARLPDPANIGIKTEFNKLSGIYKSWSERFVDAYNIEIQQWIDNTLKGVVEGPSSWDGYVGQKVAAAASLARDNQKRVDIEVEATPSFYK